ncbi:MAG: hypothetical protein AB1641_24955 [Thermodesulfobacteriota bacterium]
MFKTRKEFLLEFMRLADLKSLEEADRIAQVAIGLIKARIGGPLSELVAEAVPEDLSKGWRMIALPNDAMELQEMVCEETLVLEEVSENPIPASKVETPSYG